MSQIVIGCTIFTIPKNRKKAVEKENKLFIGPKQVFFLSFGPMKSLFSFPTAKTEKNLWKKLEKTRLVVWWFDVTNKIIDHF